ncbi:hypothetical protein CC80DRAFT_515286 [Byssothecium circinans]|uniref:NAD(P)-binding protein n=1 Tax=Byssothecium circinans TaxID=147558 RepID=A0A6A5U452_9PLEO|nr:hypothetical protein CC80DRAFT_515286 [Byssothecium circinans]
MPSVVILGAAGFVGAQAARIIVGDFSDFEKIKTASKEHDFVINAGNSFTRDAVTAIIAGLTERPSASKGKLIHISGGGNFIDFEDIKSTTKGMFNGKSDTTVLETGTEGPVETYIVCPSVVYGGASVASLTKGLVTGNAKPLGYVPYVDEGTAVLNTPGAAEGRTYSHYQMLETSNVTSKDMVAELAKVMHSRRIFSSSEPKSVLFEQAGEGEVKHLVAANMIVEGPRAAALGFKPKQPSIFTEIHYHLKDVRI